MQNWPGMASGLLAVLLGCAPRAPAGGSQPLAGSLDVRVAGDTVQLALHVTNVRGAPLVLHFASAQRFDFVIRSAAGVEVWRWSADRMFAQTTGEEHLEPGATRVWRASWLAGGQRGTYQADGRLLAGEQPLLLTATFEVGRE